MTKGRAQMKPGVVVLLAVLVLAAMVSAGYMVMCAYIATVTGSTAGLADIGNAAALTAGLSALAVVIRLGALVAVMTGGWGHGKLAGWATAPGRGGPAVSGHEKTRPLPGNGWYVHNYAPACCVDAIPLEGMSPRRASTRVWVWGRGRRGLAAGKRRSRPV